MSGLHWDEYTDPSSYYGGALWTAEWPADVAEWEAAAGLRAAWADRPFCSHGGLLAVAVRSWTMVRSSGLTVRIAWLIKVTLTAMCP